MSKPTFPQKAKLFLGILFVDYSFLKKALGYLNRHFGAIDFATCPRIFSETSYYEDEMGSPIYRIYVTFHELIEPEDLVTIKLLTNEIEEKLSFEGKRRVNLDPGLLSEERLVLATGKNYTHRIYLGSGIYGDLTLIYKKGAYRPLEWTYPDYRDPLLIHFLGVLRKKLKAVRR